MANIEFKCPYCGQELNGGDDLAGETVECPSCGKEFTVPGFGAMPAAPAYEAPAGGSAADNDKTVKIELPPEFLAEPEKHVFKIKRIQR